MNLQAFRAASAAGFVDRFKKLTESLILAQNERWQRGLGMQVERESSGSSFRTRTRGGEWRKGE